MEYQDRTKIATPEAVELSFALAGVGSRALATGIDYAIQISLFSVVLLFAILLAGVAGDAALIIFASLAGFFVIYVYDVLFEAFRGGRTPGKQVSGLRVVRDTGAPVDLRAALIRNIVKLVDGPLTLYAVGIASIIVTRRNQRLGDLAAGTLVVRERFASEPKAPPPLPPGWSQPAPAPVPGSVRRWDTGGVSAADITVVRGFLRRRMELDREPRGRIGTDLAGHLRPLVAGADSSMTDERFLEELVADFDRE